jgi:hypothetical protein
MHEQMSQFMSNGEALATAASLYVYPDNRLIPIAQSKSRLWTVETVPCDLKTH